MWKKLLLLPAILLAYTEHEYTNATLANEPSSTINGCVSAITGEYFFHQTDYHHHAAEPITINRTYLSDSQYGRQPIWKITPQLELYCGTDENGKNDYTGYFHIQDDFGTRIVFVEGKVHTGAGATNSAHGFPSGQYSIANYTCEITKHFVFITTPNGTRKKFIKNHRKKRDLLVNERRPNGNSTSYEYHPDGTLARIISEGPEVHNRRRYGTIHVDKTSDKIIYKDEHKPLLTYQYHIEKKKKREFYVLTDVFSQQNPQETLTYHYPGTYKPALLITRAFPEGRGVHIDYYQQLKNHVGEEIVEFKYSDDTRFNRVRSIKYPFGPTPLATHTFIYNIETENKSTTVTDAEGNKAHYYYDKNLRLTKIEKFFSDTSTLTETFEWDDDGHIQKRTLIIDGKDHQITEYVYDKKHNPIKETITADFCGDGSKQSHTTEYTYTNDAYNLVTSIQKPNGATETYTYLPDTNLPTSKIVSHGKISLRHFYEYSRHNVLKNEIIDDGTTDDPKSLEGVTFRNIKRMVIRKTNPGLSFPEEISELALNLKTGREELHHKTIFTYNKANYPIREDHYDAEEKFRYAIHKTYDQKGRLKTETDPLGRKTTYTYDANNNITSQSSDAEPLTTRIIYNTMNQQTSIRSGPKYTTTTTYDHLGRPTNEYDIRGYPTTTHYDKQSRPVTTLDKPDANGHHPKTTRTFDTLGRITSETDPDGNTTRTTYNARNQPVTITYPDGTCETKTYTLEGNLETQTLQNGTTLHHTYDYQDRLTKKITVDADGYEILREKWTYNAFFLLSYRAPNGLLTTYTYDLAGRKKTETTGNRTTEYRYDPLGHLKTTIENRERITRTNRDIAGRLITTTETDLTGKIHTQTKNTYNNYDQLLATETTTPAGPAKTTYTYDALSRQTSTTDPLGHCTTTTYQDFGTQTETITDPKGRTLKTTYDPLGRPILIEKRSPENLLYTSRATYTPAGDKISRRIEIPERTIDQKWVYNSMHRKTTFIDAAKAPEQQTTTYTYTPTGQIERLTKPSGVTLHHTYDPLDNLTHLYSSDDTIDITYTHNKNGQILTAIDHINGTTTTRAYDKYGNITSETLGNGLTLKKRFDTSGRPTTITLPDKTTIEKTYDPYHLTSVTHKDFTHTYTYTNHHPTEEKNRYTTHAHTYDLLSRRTSTKSDTHSDTIHNFDSTGNPTSRTLINDIEKKFTYTYDENDHLLTDTYHTYAYDNLHNRTAIDDENATYNHLNQNTAHDHDPNGNPTQDDSHTYTYDALGRLTQIDDTPLIHDPFNRLIIQGVEKILYDGDYDIATYENTTQKNLRILGNTPTGDIGATLLIYQQNQPHHPLHDLLGNIIHLSTPLHYDAYGPTTTHPSPWQYQSKRKISSLFYFTNRYYNPTTGRFLTPDPLGHTDTHNLYHYLHSNPLTAHDPLGLIEMGDYVTPEGSKTTFTNVQIPDSQYFRYEFPCFCFPGAIDLHLVSQALDHYSNDHHFVATGTEDPGNVVFSFGNGLDNPRGVVESHVKHIQSQIGNKPFSVTYNDSFGVVGDGTHALCEMIGIPTAPTIQEINYLHHVLRDSPENKLLKIIHSEYSFIFDNAVKYANLSEEELSRIQVYALSPAKILKNRGYRDIMNYVPRSNDLIPQTSNILNATSQLLFKTQQRASIMYLNSKDTGLIGAHGVQSETHKQSFGSIKQRMNKFAYK